MERVTHLRTTTIGDGVLVSICAPLYRANTDAIDQAKDSSWRRVWLCGYARSDLISKHAADEVPEIAYGAQFHCADVRRRRGRKSKIRECASYLTLPIDGQRGHGGRGQ
jgi:hypothetical protein